ncbi:MAG: hypothetical protein [Bacteriophage sp.]|nr:MAG: hypothetical protein [Bacteriophage sp.]
MLTATSLWRRRSQADGSADTAQIMPSALRRWGRLIRHGSHRLKALGHRFSDQAQGRASWADKGDVCRLGSAVAYTLDLCPSSLAQGRCCGSCHIMATA